VAARTSFWGMRIQSALPVEFGRCKEIVVGVDSSDHKDVSVRQQSGRVPGARSRRRRPLVGSLTYHSTRN